MQFAEGFACGWFALLALFIALNGLTVRFTVSKDGVKVDHAREP